MKKNFIIVFVTVLLLYTHFLAAGPFGLEMGMSLIDLEALGVNPTMIEKSYYMVNPPSPHSDFELYMVQLDPNEGVFMIKALGKDISDSGYGFAIKSAFSEIEQALDSAYGEGEMVNILLPGSIWDEMNDWMISIYKDERFYFKKWEKNDGTAISNGILSIYLGANATSSSKGYLALEYLGIEHDRLSQKVKDEESKVF